jgi:protein gp37
MSGGTTIEWTRGDDGAAAVTWNPVTGCTEVSEGCDNCYARTFAERWRGVPGHPFEQGFDVCDHEDVAMAPWMLAVLPNAWLRVSVESQRWARVRLPLLAETPAVVRFASCEPLLGALDLRPWLDGGLGWVIAGGESGPRARPMHPDWARALHDQCQATDVAF